MRTHSRAVWWRLAPAALLILLLSGCTTFFGPGQFARPGSYPSAEPATITLEPVEDTNPIRTQHRIKAVVKDAQGKPVHSGLVEWTLARTPGAVGDIVSVTQDPWNRALKVDNTFAIGGLDYNGEGSITITSPVEGITHIIAHMPDIKDPSKHKVFAIKNWLDAAWTFPPPATNKVGTKHVMATKVVRASDGTPLEGYEIRWKVASGPPAVFEEGGRDEAVTKTGEDGVAKVTLTQARPAAGTNTISIQVTKPRDPGRACCPTPFGRIAEGSTTKTWIAPALSIKKTCPATVVKNEVAQFSFVVTNPSQVDAADVVAKDVLPAGFEYVSSAPAGTAQGSTISWNLGTLAGGASRTITVSARATQVGSFTNQVSATSSEGLTVQDACPTRVTEAQISIAKTCPAEGIVGEELRYVVTVRNPGTATASNVVVTDTVPEGMRHASGGNQVTWRVGDLLPGSSATETFVFTAERTGTFTNVVKVEAAGGLQDETKCQTIIREPRIAIKKGGRERQVLGRTVTYTITVTNPGTAPATGVTLQDQLQSGLNFVSSTPAGTYNTATRIATWDLGTIAPNQERTVQVTARGDVEGRLCDTATVTAQGNLSDRAEACTVFAGVAGVLLELVDNPDPVEVGTTTIYTITVTNQGSTPLTNLRVVAKIPAGETYVSHVGATQATASAQAVTFAPYPSLPVGQKFTHTVTVRSVGIAGQDQSDVRFEVVLTGDQLTEPVTREESTHLYR